MEQEISIVTIGASRSFIILNKVWDIYTIHVHFRVLHKISYINDQLSKMVFKENATCSVCNERRDSNEHMLLFCRESISFWEDVEHWISERGMEKYNLSRIIVED